MTTKTERNAKLRRRRGRGASIGILAREFAISTMRVRQLLEATGGDPLRADVSVEEFARLSMADLERERERLADRIASDRRRLRVVDDELDVRRSDRVLGLTC